MTAPLLHKQAALVYDMYLKDRLTFDEYIEWMDQLKRPNTLWGWISWKVFGL